MAGNYPSLNDSNFDLLKKITSNTAEIANEADIPSQPGNSGKLLTTNGTTTAWTTNGTLTSLTSPAATNLTLGLGTGGTALTLTNSTLAATFAGTLTTAGDITAGDNTHLGRLNVNDSTGGLGEVLIYGNVLKMSARTAGGSLGFRVNGDNSTVLDIASTGVVSISSTTAGSSGAGALVVAGGISAGNTGAASYFGGAINGASNSATATGLSLSNVQTNNGYNQILLQGSGGSNIYGVALRQSTTNTAVHGGDFDLLCANSSNVLTSRMSIVGTTGAATFGGAVTIGGDLTLTAGRIAVTTSGTQGGLIITNTAGAALRVDDTTPNGDWQINSGANAARFEIRNADRASSDFQLDNTTGAATFGTTNTVTMVNGAISASAAGNQGTISNVNGDYMKWNSTHASGGYHTLLKDSTAFAYFGSGKQLLGSLAATDFALDASTGNFYVLTAGTQRLSITSTTATFAGAVTAVGDLFGSYSASGAVKLTNSNGIGGIFGYSDAGTTTQWYIASDATNLLIGTGTALPVAIRTNGINALTISTTQAATFAGAVTVTPPNGTDGLRVISAGDQSNLYLETTGGGANKNWLITNNFNAAGNLEIRQSNSNGGDPRNAGTSRFVISPTGDVNIASTTAGASNAGALVVQGGISAGNTGVASYFGGAVTVSSTTNLATSDTTVKSLTVGPRTTVTGGITGSDTILQVSGYSGDQNWAGALRLCSQDGTSTNVTLIGQGGGLRVGTAGTTRLTIDSTGAATFAGAVTVATGNLVIGTAGNGIDFSATSSGSGTMTSELLNDYEEGTWVPTVGGNATYTATQKASYTKIGRLVTVSFAMEIILIGTGSTTSISGLPFVVGSATSPKFEQGFGAHGYFQLLAVNVYSLTFYAAPNTSQINSMSTNVLGTYANVDPAIYGDGTFVQGTVTYMAA